MNQTGVIIAGVVLLVACGKRTHAPAPEAAPVVVTAPAPAPPRPGHATLAFHGAFVKRIDADGASCGDGTYGVGAADAGDTDARPDWNFYAVEQSPGEWVITLALTDHPDAPRHEYAWKGPAGAPRLAVSGSSATVAATLLDPAGAKVDVAGELRCETYSSAPVPPAITALLERETGSRARPYSTYDFGRARYQGAASAIVTGDQTSVEATVRSLRRALPPGWVAYIGTTNFLGDELPPRGASELVVAPGAGPLDIVRDARTDGTNYGLMTEALVRKLAGWDRQWGIDVLHAETDTIELKLARLPDDLPAFAREVYAFCPDVVDQGTDSVEELAREIAVYKRVFLWWD